MRLDPALTVGGIVVDEQGSPVSDVAIFVGTPGRKSGHTETIVESIDFQTCPVTNHEDGTWTCSYIPKNWTNGIGFILKKPDYVITQTGVPLPQTNLSRLVLVIERGFTIAGFVVDQQDRPVARAKIKVLEGDNSEGKPTYTDENGFYEVTGLPGETMGSTRACRIVSASQWVRRHGQEAGSESRHEHRQFCIVAGEHLSRSRRG